MPAAKQQRIGGGRTNLPLGEVAAMLTHRSQLSHRAEPLRPTVDKDGDDSAPAANAQKERPTQHASSSVIKAVPSRSRFQHAANSSEEAHGDHKGGMMAHDGDDNTPLSQRAERPATSSEGMGRRPAKTSARSDIFQADLGEKRPWTAPASSHGANSGGARNRPDSAFSGADSVIESKVIDFQRSFQNKNGTKFRNIQGAFR